jgi:hypothetical protein
VSSRRQIARKYLGPQLESDPNLILRLAVQCDVSPNTIRRYLLTNEPMHPASIRRIEAVTTNRAKLLKAAEALRESLTEDDWQVIQAARAGNLR